MGIRPIDYNVRPMQIRLRTLTLILWLIALFDASGVVYYGQNTPMAGPLVATTNGAQDSVLLIEADSGRIRAFSTGEGIHSVWDFSPDGCELLVTVTSAYGLPRLLIVSLTGEVISQPVHYLDQPESLWGVWEPDWSPDGTRIAFRMMRDSLEGEPERQYHIGWVSPEGSEPAFYSVSGREHSPKWSPDGSWLAYVSYDKRAPGVDDRSTAEPTAEDLTAPEDLIQEADLWVVSSDASVKMRMTGFETGSVRSPRWSPDGQWIGFVYSPSPSNDTYWVVPNNDASPEQQVTYGYGLSLDLTWTPDGELLASARGLGGQTTHGLWRVPVSVGSDNLLSPFISSDLLPYPDYPAFNASGTRLAVRSGYRVALVDIATTKISFVVGAEGNMPLIWSPESFSSEANCAGK